MATTRQSLVDAARKLFGQFGVKNTTMNDIAVESQRGRRTLYTYFKNKNELLDAVIEDELQFVISSLEEVLKLDLEPLEKLIHFITVRMNVVRTAVQRNGSLQAEFFRDVIRVELVRRKFEKIEIKYLKELLLNGVEKKVFDVSNIQQTAIFIHFVMRGLDVPYIRGMFDNPDNEQEDISRIKNKILIMVKGILKEGNDL
ncbi:MAG: TetR/AcrR family transcriptional regulator [Bacteroidales bacterium]|nr:TetR/AcrR family transcriptional regulator [Bacteroidales bacterium]